MVLYKGSKTQRKERMKLATSSFPLKTP
jgi:hypothetical protein